MKKDTKADDFYARTALLLSLGFWIPLFNIGLCITSLILAFRALKFIDSSPKDYAGKKMAIAAIVISILAIILTAVGVVIYVIRSLNNCPLNLPGPIS